LAGSPDGKINNDGLIEVKCPYNVRNEKVVFENIKYLNSDNGQLNRNNFYYYQVQGLLEITNRNWCDCHFDKIRHNYRKNKS